MTRTGPLGRALLRKLIPKPSDPLRGWRGTADDHPRSINILRYGDCAWREQRHGHTLGVRPGYPLVIAERLARRGIGMGWSMVYVGSYSALPTSREELVRFVRLGGAAPDVVILQLAMGYATRTILPRNQYWNDARLHLARLAGPLSRPVYWLLEKLLRRYGSTRPFDDTQSLEVFWELVADEWPDAQRIMMSPSCVPVVDGLIASEVLVRRWRHLAGRCQAIGVQTVETFAAVAERREQLGRRAVGAYMDYDLRRPGHEAVADVLLDAIERGRTSQGVREPVAGVGAA